MSLLLSASQRASDVRSRTMQAVIGMWAYSDPLNAAASITNADPQAAQVDTITVNTATASNVYEYDIGGFTVEYTADGSPTVTEVAAGLVAAHNSDGSAGALALASNVAGVITLTGVQPAESYTVDAVDALMTLASVTAAAEADAVPIGRVMIYLSADDDAGHLGCLVKAAKLTAKVDTITVAYAASEVYKIQITIEGKTCLAEVDADTDDATTATNIRTAINAMMPDNTVIASGATDQIILTAEVAGKSFLTVVGVKSETVARLALVNTTNTALTDINRCIAGVSMWWSALESTAIGSSTPSWPANAGVILARRGVLWVESAQSVSRGDKVYVETGVTADNGQLYNTTSATRILLTGATWEKDERSTQTDGIAAVRLAL